MHRTFSFAVTCVMIASAGIIAAQEPLAGTVPPANGIWLDTLDLEAVRQDIKKARAGRSVSGFPLTLNGEVFEHGIGTAAASEFSIDLKGAALRFRAFAGVDDATKGRGSAAFSVWVDGARSAESPVLRGNDPPHYFDVDLSGAQSLLLLVSDGGDGNANDHADWAGAALILSPGATAQPSAHIPEEEAPAIYTGGAPLEPAIHGPRITGATPGRPFLFLVPATGEGPLAFSAENLPEGLSLDAGTGIISGALAREGTTDVTLTVTGPKGAASRVLTVVGGEDKLALTPPMGWNSWNVWGVKVDDAKVRAAADYMASTGLAAYGYQYINVDDAWEADRGADGEIICNEKFPDMKALGDYIHAKGLKFGMYSSPGPKTCAGYTGSYQYERQDAQTYARWGVDFLKYDWCSYQAVAGGVDREALIKPYLLMRAALDECDRDIVYSICQYGMGDVWEWGDEAGGNLWRTTGDIGDSWNSVSKIGFAQNGLEAYAGPGCWNDPDMLVVGTVGWGKKMRPTPLTKNEQVAHITLWTVLAAPLLLGCDLAQLDAFTLALMTNDEVIDVNQDPLGKQGWRCAGDPWAEIWMKPLYDGTLAVALFNRAPVKTALSARWDDLGISGSQPVRDLWQRKDLEPADGVFTAQVPAHGAMLVKIGTPKG